MLIRREKSQRLYRNIYGELGYTLKRIQRKLISLTTETVYTEIL